MPYAMSIPRPGGPEVFERITVPRPVPGPGQLLVRVAAVGMNFIETYQRAGVYAVDYPFVPGVEAAGVIEEIGIDVSGFPVGARITTTEGAGSYAEYMLVDADKALPVPAGIDDETAAALPAQGITAHYLINSSYRVQPGETVLTHAGAGGVGLLLTQMLKHRGATVITTTSTPQKAERAFAAGADHVLAYEEVPRRVRELTGGRGADVVYDGVGKDTFEASLASLRVRGTMVLFSGASGQVPPFDLQRLNSHGSLTVTRPKIDDFLLDAEERRWRSRELFDLVERGIVKVDIGARFGLEQAAKAHAALESRATTGKVILVP